MLAPGLDQPAQQRALAHDLRVGAHVGRGRAYRAPACRDRRGRRPPSAARAFELLGHRHRIAGLAALDQLGERLEDQPVIGAVEILGA